MVTHTNLKFTVVRKAIHLLTQSLSEHVVIDLGADILKSNYTLYTDNFYRSVSLSKFLLFQNTHLVGTFKSEL